MVVAATASAQVSAGCSVDTLDAVFPTRWAGVTIGQVTVRARNVDTPFKIATTLAQYVHRSTRLNVALNELSFAPGDATDELTVLESMRRLRTVPRELLGTTRVKN